jgi:alpha-N-arabinofuranosidase
MHADNPQNDSGDHRFYNNLFLGSASLSALDQTALPCQAGGNVYLQGARPATFEAAPLVVPEFAAGLKLEQKTDGWYLTLHGDVAWRTAAQGKPVTTATLGRAVIPGCAYENADGSPFQLLTDYFGQNREVAHPFPGPFESLRTGTNTLKVWPVR